MTTSTNELKIEIMDGPSASRTVDAFKYAYDKEGALTAIFTLSGDVKISLRVTSLEHEDGSGSSLNIIGYIISITKKVFGREIVITNENFRVRLYYHARPRQGAIFFNSIREYDLCKPTARKRCLL